MEQELKKISDGRSTYERWLADEGVSVVGGYYIPDLKDLELDAWPRKGVRGAVLRLKGAEDTNDAHVLEIPPGGKTAPEHHIFEELVFVVTGRGATTVWQEEGHEHSFEWGPGSLFAIPLNAWYQHFNGTGSAAARLLSVTSAPLVINLFHNHDFVFDNPFVFRDRFNPDVPDFFSGDGEAFDGRIWETNFIPNVDDVELMRWEARGGKGLNRMLELANSSMCAHISGFPVGTYKKAHRHGPGAHVVILDGTGYSLMWPEGSPIQRFDWNPGAVIVPPDRWFHQHFNTGRTEARYLALRWGSRKHKVFASSGSGTDRVQTSTRLGGDQIDYEDEAREVREMFKEACRENGVAAQMEQYWPK